MSPTIPLLGPESMFMKLTTSMPDEDLRTVEARRYLVLACPFAPWVVCPADRKAMPAWAWQCLLMPLLNVAENPAIAATLRNINAFTHTLTDAALSRIVGELDGREDMQRRDLFPAFGD